MGANDQVGEVLTRDKNLVPDQWYAVRASAAVRRTSAGRFETKGLKVNIVKVDSPDQVPPEPEPPEGGEGEGEATPKPV